MADTTSSSLPGLAGMAVLCLFVMGCNGDDDPGPDPSVQTCESSQCHGGPDDDKHIEVAHPGADLACTDCHGGDAKAPAKSDAHVVATQDWLIEKRGYIRNMSVSELDRVDPEYVRFVNPGDYRVAQVGCGSGSPAADGGACHQGQVDSAPRAVMATFAGHFDVPRFQADMQGRLAEVGSRDIVALDMGELPPGAVAELRQAAVPPAGAPLDSMDTLMDHYLTKNCTHCHSWNFGRNQVQGNFRSSGCTSCHMVYDNSGLSMTDDPSAVRKLGHPIRHELTVKIPSDQCEHCHYQGARIGLLYRGVIEWGFDDEPDPELEPIGERLHGHNEEFYLKGGTKYPADLHYSAGMGCVDCHSGRDVHGDGNIYSTSKFEVSVRCENCHGNIDQSIQEGTATPPLLEGGKPEEECAGVTGSQDGFLNCNGDVLRGVHRRDDDSIWLELSSGDKDIQVPQIQPILAAGFNPEMNRAMGRDPDTGVSHTEIIECHGCHTAYRQYCFGCHVDMNYTEEKADFLSGVPTLGTETASRDYASFDLYFLGQNRRGKVASFCPSMQVFGTAKESDGAGGTREIFSERIRTRPDGKRGFNWAVDQPHIASRTPQPCKRCHADEADGCNDEMARQTYGFGTGRFMRTDGDGVEYDLTQLLDANGDPLVDFSHIGQGPVDKARIEAALGRCVQ